MTSLMTKTTTPAARLWLPERVLFTPAALAEPWGQQILNRVQALNLPIEELAHNRLTGLRGETDRQTYDTSKRTLAVVTAPPSSFKLSPIPPSADWQFHLAEGCPAHCQYCYLAGSLSGPPVIRAFANLPQILANLAAYEGERSTSFEVSCYTDRVGVVIAPIMAIEDWREHYAHLFDSIEAALDFDVDLTFELITHRFTPGSKSVLQTWYPQSSLDLDEEKRSQKRNKFGGVKYVYEPETMQELRRFFEAEIQRRFPAAQLLYWT